MFAKFDEIPSMILQDIKETKRYGHTEGRTEGRTDNVKTVYPPTNTVCRGYNKTNILCSSTAVTMLYNVHAHSPGVKMSQFNRFMDRKLKDYCV